MSFKILLAEDNSMMRALAKRYVSKDYEIIEFENGLSALYRISDGGIDVAIIDDVMPFFDGSCLLALIKHINEFSFWYKQAKQKGQEVNTAMSLALDSLKKKYCIEDKTGKIKISELLSETISFEQDPKYKLPETGIEKRRNAVECLFRDCSKMHVILTVKKERDSPEYRKKINNLGPPDGYIVKPEYFILTKIIEDLTHGRMN